MAAQAKKSRRIARPDPFNRTVVYYGIKIPPLSGKLSPTAKAIREALRSQTKLTRGKPARG